MATAISAPKSVELFYSYAHSDELLCRELQKHLTALKRAGLISDWYDREIEPGSEWAAEIQGAMERAGLILLLISADFLASQYIFEVELPFALKRHDAGLARVIPVLLRPVEWRDSPFAKLQILPTQARAVTLWPNPDQAFCDIAARLRELIYEQRLDNARHEIQTPAGNRAQTRFFDAALASTVILDEPTDLVAMFRTSESGGLKAILRLDRSYSAAGEDVKSNSLEIEFVTDPFGQPLPATVELALQAPGFDPPSDRKSVRIPALGDSAVFVFLLTPKHLGTLRVNLQILAAGTVIGSHLLATKSVVALAAEPSISYGLLSQLVSQPMAQPAFEPRVMSPPPQQAAKPRAVLKRSNLSKWIAASSSVAALALVAVIWNQSMSRPAPVGSVPIAPTAYLPKPEPPATQVITPQQLATSLTEIRQGLRNLQPLPANLTPARTRLDTNLVKAQTALDSHRFDLAQHYLTQAKKDLAALEATRQ